MVFAVQSWSLFYTWFHSAGVNLLPHKTVLNLHWNKAFIVTRVSVMYVKIHNVVISSSSRWYLSFGSFHTVLNGLLFVSTLKTFGLVHVLGYFTFNLELPVLIVSTTVGQSTVTWQHMSLLSVISAKHTYFQTLMHHMVVSLPLHAWPSY